MAPHIRHGHITRAICSPVVTSLKLSTRFSPNALTIASRSWSPITGCVLTFGRLCDKCSCSAASSSRNAYPCCTVLIDWLEADSSRAPSGLYRGWLLPKTKLYREMLRHEPLVSIRSQCPLLARSVAKKCAQNQVHSRCCDYERFNR